MEWILAGVSVAMFLLCVVAVILANRRLRSQVEYLRASCGRLDAMVDKAKAERNECWLSAAGLAEDLDAAACACEVALAEAKKYKEFLHIEMLGHDQATGGLFLACSHFRSLDLCPPGRAECPEEDASCWHCWLDWLTSSADEAAARDGGFEYENRGLVPALAEKQRMAEDLCAAVAEHEDVYELLQDARAEIHGWCGYEIRFERIMDTAAGLLGVPRNDLLTKDKDELAAMIALGSVS